MVVLIKCHQEALEQRILTVLDASFTSESRGILSSLVHRRRVFDADVKAAIVEAACARLAQSAPEQVHSLALAPILEAWEGLLEAASTVVACEASARGLSLGERGLPPLESVALRVATRRWKSLSLDPGVSLSSIQDDEWTPASRDTSADGAADGHPDPIEVAEVEGGGEALMELDAEQDAVEATVAPEAGMRRDVPSLSALAAEYLQEAEEAAILEGERASVIGAALDRACKVERFLLTDAAAAVLKGRIAAALLRGEELEAATRAAVAAYHRRLVRRQVQQSTWDPSSNTSRKVSGVLKVRMQQTSYPQSPALLCNVCVPSASDFALRNTSTL